MFGNGNVTFPPQVMRQVGLKLHSEHVPAFQTFILQEWGEMLARRPAQVQFTECGLKAQAH